MLKDTDAYIQELLHKRRGNGLHEAEQLQEYGFRYSGIEGIRGS
jgi:hypothetical protein